MTEYLTTQELADLLRIKQRKVYDMAAKGQIPCSRAMGKLLFPRAEVQAWVAAGGIGGGPWTETQGAVQPPPRERPAVFLGSHDPLLEWALRQSQCGLATFFDGSLDGLNRFENYEGVATGLHIYADANGRNAEDRGEGNWNVAAVNGRFAHAPVVLVELARRERGLIVKPDRVENFTGGADLKGRLIVPRQDGAGSQILLQHLLAEAGLSDGDYVMTAPALTETDAAETVAQDLGEVALGLKQAADQFALGFVPLMHERFDLLIDRRAWFEPPLQALLNFCRTSAFTDKAEAMGGYDVSQLGKVWFNGG